MQLDSSRDNLVNALLDLCYKASKRDVLRQDALIDGSQCLVAGETDCKDAEVSLEPRVDGEAACCGVHAGHVLHVVDLLQRQLGAVIPIYVFACGGKKLDTIIFSNHCTKSLPVHKCAEMSCY